MNNSAPLNYAKRLAYLGNASTIRARVLDYYDRAPSLAVCQRIVDERRREFEQVAKAPEQREREYRRDLEREAARRYRERKKAAQNAA